MRLLGNVNETLSFNEWEKKIVNGCEEWRNTILVVLRNVQTKRI